MEIRAIVDVCDVKIDIIAKMRTRRPGKYR